MTATTRTPSSDGLTKLTVNLLPQAIAALNSAAEETGDTRTDTVNRALQFYALFAHYEREGWRIEVSRPAGGVMGRFVGARAVKQLSVLGKEESE